MLEYSVSVQRRDASGSTAQAHGATLDLDTSLAGRPEALNPVELLLAAIAACMIKGVERAAPMLRFRFTTVAVELRAVRQDAPPKLQSVTYRLIVGTDESPRRLELLHTNVRKYGTVSNSIAEAVGLSGTIEKRSA